jgi:hypothetical protein
MAWVIVEEYAKALRRSTQTGSVRPPVNVHQRRLVGTFEDTREAFCTLEKQYDQLEKEKLELAAYDLARANVEDFALALSRSKEYGYLRPPVNNAQHRIMNMFEDTCKEYRAIVEQYDQLEAEHFEPAPRPVPRGRLQAPATHHGAHCSTCTCDPASQPQSESARSPRPINQLQGGE